MKSIKKARTGSVRVSLSLKENLSRSESGLFLIEKMLLPHIWNERLAESKRALQASFVPPCTRGDFCREQPCVGRLFSTHFEPSAQTAYRR
ncbi:MAG: hypothetical protein IJL15_02925 [Clostridia bacterium]|nr:hypothetical protein [Clostridia bacterium]